MNMYTSAHFNYHDDFYFLAEMIYNSYNNSDCMAIRLGKSGDLSLYLSPDQAQQLASHILSQLQAHRANELYKIQTEYALMDEGDKNNA